MTSSSGSPATPGPDGPDGPDGSGAGSGAGGTASATAVALRRLVAAAELVRPSVAQQARLTPSEVRALDLLSEGPLGPAEIARRLDVTTAASSGIVDRLVAHGHAVRTPHPSDRRRRVVQITDSGRADTMRLLLPMLQRLAGLDASLDEHDREVVTRYLEGATEALLAVVPPEHRARLGG